MHCSSLDRCTHQPKVSNLTERNFDVHSKISFIVIGFCAGGQRGWNSKHLRRAINCKANFHSQISCKKAKEEFAFFHLIMDHVNRRTRSSQHGHPKTGLSLRQGARVPLGEISSNASSGFDHNRTQKHQVRAHLLAFMYNFKTFLVLSQNLRLLPYSRMKMLRARYLKALLKRKTYPRYG